MCIEPSDPIVILASQGRDSSPLVVVEAHHDVIAFEFDTSGAESDKLLEKLVVAELTQPLEGCGFPLHQVLTLWI